MTRPRPSLVYFPRFCLFFALSLLALQPLSAQSSTELAVQDEAATRGLFNDYSVSNYKLATFDGLLLDARLYEPDRDAFPGRRPALIMANSWTLNEYQYEVQARRFANRGYIVLAYATRGFGGSDGTITVAGPNDVRDFSTIIDWIEANTRVDSQRIGFAGVSYGGGLALMALATEPRIKTAAAMSSWGNLEEALDRNETVQNVWLKILLGTGRLLGNLDPTIDSLVKNLLARNDVDGTLEWARARSPQYLVDRINAKGAAVFLQNSYLDALFPPLQIRKFYDSLQGPKRFVLDEGIHASSAIPGLLGVPSPLWDEVHTFMDRFLMGQNIPVKTGITFQVGRDVESYTSFPALTSSPLGFQTRNRTFRDVSGRDVVRITGNKDSGASSGVVIVADMLDSFTNIPVYKKIADIDQRYGIVFDAPELKKNLKVRGSPKVSFRVGPIASPAAFVAYLYDVDRWGKGRLLSYSVYSTYKPRTEDSMVSFSLNTTAFDVEKGHRLALVIDTTDPLYGKPTEGTYSLDFLTDSAPQLDLPLVP